MSDIPLHPATKHMTAEQQRLYRLDMIKLNAILPAMLLTVEERMTIARLITLYFQGEKPPELPWVVKDHARQARAKDAHSTDLKREKEK